ncbi:hypothetical protein [Flagellimonas allohymeniacidonis]|uniref:SGNH/GDSL hydrolase family protein n=1 Tax=Flagellimonas allohymeniacidonis TaxID=2517819 RepID=A0A4Q8QDK7_9FLAO|nr:hypothetical protein [Allomuricauda hymeniacidonis]TAI48562.1 hypothetical protein EW142_01805 [Allomuricauda hymeniacidonis]
MAKFIARCIFFGFVFFLCFELLVRAFHLHNQRPIRYLDEQDVEKWVPHQEGYSVVGNRRQNVGHYRINSFGFNSVYDSYRPKESEKSVALIGDSFIEGFHQDFDNSLGQKIEGKLKSNSKVFEFGYAGYDFADQLHLIHSYSVLFDDMDQVLIYMRFIDDLERSEYEVSSRLSLDTPISRLAKHFKSIVYLKDIGLLDPVTHAISKLGNLRAKNRVSDSTEETESDITFARIQNFKDLVDFYDYDKSKNVLLVDYRLCPSEFLDFLKENEFKTIDFGESLARSKSPTDLIYDQHWNDHGRELIAKEIANYLNNFD